jgi:hypothetical protein
VYPKRRLAWDNNYINVLAKEVLMTPIQLAIYTAANEGYFTRPLTSSKEGLQTDKKIYN